MRLKSLLLDRGLLTLAAFVALTGKTEAGSGRYDKATRSFAMTYIYLDLPSGLIDQAGALSAARPRRPTAEQAANIQRFWRKTSDMLAQVTGGRARIGSLEETRDVARADAIISLTGRVKPRAGGAWAQVRGWNVPSATLNLYYEDLVNDPAADVTMTVVHELMHYLVGLPDEYPRSSPAALCPRNAPGGLRCLMDNFHMGWNGRLCTAADHNPSAPGANGYPAVTPPGTSCQELLDQFFARLGVSAGIPEEPRPPVVTSQETEPPPMTETAVPPRKGLLGRARDEIRKMKARGAKLRIDGDDRGRVKDFIVRAVGGVILPNAARLAGRLILAELGIPPGLSLIGRALRGEAARLARESDEPLQAMKSVEIAAELREFARARLQEAGAPTALSAEEIRYIYALGQGAAEGQDVTDVETPEQVEADLLREVPGVVPPVVPPGNIPDASLGDRPERRRTVVIAPPVLVGAISGAGIDRAETQGYPETAAESDYNGIRRLALREFARMTDRARVELLTVVASRGAGGPGLTPYEPALVDGAFASDRTEGDAAGADVAAVRRVLDARRARFAGGLALIGDELGRDRVDHVVLLVPPGGLPDESAEGLVPLRERLLGTGGGDFRVDVALVGASAWIPDALRDAVARTRGSIVTVSDVDEVGAVIQRLAGQQTQGTWVTIPEQGILVVDADPDAQRFERETPGTLFGRLRGARAPHPVRSDGESHVVLKPFHVDPATRYELVVGLAQPLTIAGLTEVEGDRGVVPDTAPSRAIFPAPTLRLVPGQVRDEEDVRRMEFRAGRLVSAPAPDLRFAPEKSTSTVLVFDLPPGIETGWFNPVLRLAGGNFRVVKDGASGPPRPYRNKAIHFTLSVGTQTSKAQMVAGLMQNVPGEITSTDGGTVDGPAATLSAVLSAGAAVLDAEVVGYVQRIESGTEPIATERVTFHDDGVAPDTQRDDGIYSARVPLPSRRERRAEYRVFVEGRSIRDRTRFVPAGEPPLPVADATPRGGSKEALEAAVEPQAVRKAPAFQRATSINFSVPARGGR